MTTNYRPDIDGLRAIAVIPVVLFHAGVPQFSGGFVGVDIFFVISGYLITSLLLNDLDQNKFSIITFYERRIRRIFPALMFVLAITSIVAFFLLMPDELKAYAKSLLAATLFCSNYHFMFDTGYFTGAADTKALLHMWSLAVEEQYYILFPVFLYFTYHYFKNHLGKATFILLLISFGYSIWIVATRPEDAFYSAPARAWELLVGSTLAIFSTRQPLNPLVGEVLSACGILAIAYSVFFYTNITVFPGTGALLPVLGAALVIFAGSEHQYAANRLLATKPFRFIGLISYSLYLWHWPILVFYKSYVSQIPSDVEITIIVITVVAISYFSWKFVETPFRTRRYYPNKKQLFVYAVGTMSVCLLVVGTTYVANGFPNRFPQPVINILHAADDRFSISRDLTLQTSDGRSVFAASLGLSNRQRPSFAVWGDSHGESLFPGIDASAKNQGVQGIFFGRGGCPPLSGIRQVRQDYESCVDDANVFLDYLDEHPEIHTIFLASRWSIYAMGRRFKGEKGHIVYIMDGESMEISLNENKRVFARAFERTLKRLANSDKKIVFVAQVPETEWDIPSAMAKAKLFDITVNFQPSRRDYLLRNDFFYRLIDQYRNIFAFNVIRPDTEMCNSTSCPVERNGVPIYVDSSHITWSQSLHLSHLFDNTFK